MAGLMEPVGPEEQRTYWMRRALVGGVIVVVLIVIVALVAALSGGDDGTTAEPPAPTGPSLQPAGTPTPTTSPSASEGDTSPSPSAKTSGKADPSAKKSTDPTASGKQSEPDTKGESGTPSPKATSSKPPACKPADLRTTLTGPRTIEPGKKVTFQAGVINGGTTTCTFTLDPKTYVFRVYSGSDKIWTTADCTKWLPKVDTTLKSQQDVTWKIEWSVQRSKGCDLVNTELRAGTYAANSLLKGAKPAQLVMQLK